MKKKLLEQREKAIIENFTKTFNKIKRLNENELTETNEEPWDDLVINLGDIYYDPQKKATYKVININPNDKKNATLSQWFWGNPQNDSFYDIKLLKKDIHDGKLVKVTEIITPKNSGSDFSKWEKFKDTNPSNYNQKPEDQFMEKYPVGSQFKDARYGAIKTIKKYQGNDAFIEDEDMPGRLFQWPLLHLIQGVSKKEFIPVEQELDEINIPKVLAPVAFAAGMMGAPKDASAQTQMQSQGIERTATKEMPTQMPSDPLMAGRTILMSYRMNPFTADMWSKRSNENLRFFKTIKKMADYEERGGTLQDDDKKSLGNAYKDSQIAQDFLQRKKDDAKTARLEEDDEMYNAPEKSNHTIKTLESILRQSNYFIEKMKATPEDAFFRGAAKGAEAIKSYIENAIQNNK